MKRRGFTLTELVIVMTLSAMILLSVSSMVTLIQSHSHSRDASAAANHELTLLQTYVRAWFSETDTSEYPAPQASEYGHRLTIGDCSMVFAEQVFTLTTGKGSTEQSYSAITDVAFTVGGENNPNLVKCTVTYQADKGERKVCYLFLKKSANAPQLESAVV